jgi:hypothetical protein
MCVKAQHAQAACSRDTQHTAGRPGGKVCALLLLGRGVGHDERKR